MYVYYDTFILFTSEIRVCMATAWVAAEGPWATGIAAPSSTPARRSSASRSALCSFAPQAPLRTRRVSPPPFLRWRVRMRAMIGYASGRAVKIGRKISRFLKILAKVIRVLKDFKKISGALLKISALPERRIRQILDESSSASLKTLDKYFLAQQVLKNNGRVTPPTGTYISASRIGGRQIGTFCRANTPPHPTGQSDPAASWRPARTSYKILGSLHQPS